MLIKSKGEEAAVDVKVDDYSEESLDERVDEEFEFGDADELGDLLGVEEVD